MRRGQAGFTLIEVLIALMIMAGGILMISLAWSGNLMRLRKSALYSDVATLLERKMVETEAKYHGKDLKEIPEEEEGDFGEEAPRFYWKMKSQELEFPDISALIIGQEQGGDEMLLTMIKQMTEYLGKTIKEVKVTVYVKSRGKKDMEFSATQYFIDYNQDFAGAMAGGGGAAVMTKKNGFTLVEIMIAMFILSFLSLFTVQAIQKALKDKSKTQKDIDKNATMRDALRVMERDINLAFNYRDIYAQLYNDAQDERKKKAQQPVVPAGSGSGSQAVPPPTTPPPPLNPVDEAKYKHKDTKVWTHFIGEPQAIHFTSLSNIRMMEDSPVSSQAEIGYHIKGCRRRSTQEQSSKCLWRRVSNYIHEDITKEGEETVLLENITEFKLRYLGPGKDEEWVDTWITNERGDDATKGKFPYAVEITIEMKDPTPAAKDKTLRMTTVASIRNPNNPPKPATDPNAPPVQ